MTHDDPRFAGKDNYGKPRRDYVDRVVAMDDVALAKETEQAIWLSAYASNNPRSDYHWHVDACSIECRKRDSTGGMYERAFTRARGTM